VFCCISVLSNCYSELESWCCGVERNVGLDKYKNGIKIGGVGKDDARNVQDHDRTENESHYRFQRLEDLIKGLTVVVEKLSRGEKTLDEASIGNGRTEQLPEDERDPLSSHSRCRKLEIPVFAGDEAYGWTNKLERYFRLKDVRDDERMQADGGSEGEGTKLVSMVGDLQPKAYMGGFQGCGGMSVSTHYVEKSIRNLDWINPRELWKNI